MPTRRHLLGLLTAGVGAATLGALPARAADGSYDVSYLWAPALDDVLDYREQVAAVLGPDVAGSLVVVRGRTLWGLIYDRRGTSREAAQRVARAHDRLLRQALGGDDVLATVVRDSGYTRTHNVAYGAFRDLDGARARYDRVARLLGPDVHAELVIEQPAAARFEVVWKRRGDAASTARVAARHTHVLEPHGILARTIPERSLEPVWGAGSTDGGGDTPPDRAVNPGGAASPGAVVGAALQAAPRAVEAVLQKAIADAPTASEAAKAPPGGWRALPAAIDTPLRDRINAHVQGLRRRGLVAPDETTSWYVHTLHDDRTWVALNAERPLQCASMVKPYVALAFLHRVEAGRIVYGPVSQRHLAAMIQRSSNASTNWAIRQVGGPAAVQRILDDHYGELFHETRIVEAIPRYGRTYRNRSSARDYVRFCRALWFDRLPRSAELKRLLALPGRDRLTTGAPSIPAGTTVMNKTGTTSHLCGDFGILVAPTAEGGRVPYAIVGIVEKRSRASSFRTWTTTRGRVIRSVSDLVYRSLKETYGLA
jgi:beta-lactamase class A